MSIQRNEQGYLEDWLQWSEQLATNIAMEDNLTLTEDHWKVIHYLRDFYHDFEHTPVMRVFIKEMKRVLGEDKGNSPYLYQLFPDGPVKQGCKIAGLPKPPHCI